MCLRLTSLGLCCTLMNYVPYHVFYVLGAFLSLVHVFPFCFPFSSPCLSVNFMSQSQGYMRV